MLQKNFKNTLLLAHDIFHEVVYHVPGVVTLSMINDISFIKNKMIIGQGLSSDQVESLLKKGIEIIESDLIF